MSTNVPVPSGGGTSANATGEDTSAAQLVNPSAFEALETEYPSDASIDPLTRYKDEQFNAWYPDLERYVETISDECARYSTKHADASKIYNRRYQIVTIGLIIIPLLSGFMAFLPLGELFLKISSGLFSLIQAALAGLNKTMRFSEQSFIHRKASDKYSDLNSSISEQLLFPYAMRENGVLFARWGRRQFYKLRALTPYPDKKISKQMQALTSDDSIAKPSTQPTTDEIIVPPVLIDPETGQARPIPIPLIPIEDQPNINPDESDVPIIPSPSPATLPTQEEIAAETKRQREQKQREYLKKMYTQRRPIIFKSDHDR